jgi:hypothetical protein
MPVVPTSDSSALRCSSEWIGSFFCRMITKKGSSIKSKDTNFPKFAEFAKQKYPYYRINFCDKVLEREVSHCNQANSLSLLCGKL